MVTFKKSTDDTRFVAKVVELGAWTGGATSYNDLAGAGCTLDYIQVAGGTALAFEGLLNIYNTADVTVGTTDPVLRIPLQKATNETWECVLPGGIYLDTALSVSLTERDASVVSENVTVRIIYH